MQIDKNIPYPAKTQVGKGGRKYPFNEMEVGDSFFVPLVGGESIAKIRAAASGYGNYNKKQFTTLTVDGGCRVWRKT